MEFVNTRNEGAKQGLVVGYRLGLYDADPNRGKVRYVGRVFGSSDYDRNVMQLAIEKYGQASLADRELQLCLGAFPFEG